MAVSEPALSLGTECSVQELLDLYRLEPNQLSEIRSIGDRARPLIERGLNRFFSWMQQRPRLMACFTNDERWHNARTMQTLYWQDFLAAEINDTYRRKRRHIGAIHAEVGMPVLWFMAGVSMMYVELSNAAQQLSEEPGRSDELIQSIASLMHLDAGLICQAFVDRRHELLLDQGQWGQTLSAPITEAWPGLLLLPLIGDLDPARAEDLLAALLTAVQKGRACCCIVDVGGLRQLDERAVAALLGMSRGCALMGCRLTLTGLGESRRPLLQNAVAQGELTSSPTLMEAINEAVAGSTTVSGP